MPRTWTIDQLANLSLRMGEHSLEVYELLKELEWAGVGVLGDDRDRCRFCDALKWPNYPNVNEIGQHKSGCRLAAILKAVEGRESQPTPVQPEDPEAHIIREPGVYRVKRVGRITTLEKVEGEPSAP